MNADQQAALLAGAVEYRRKVKAGELPSVQKLREPLSRRFKEALALVEATERRLDELKAHELMCETSKALTGKTLLTEEEILDGAHPLSQVTGVYFLVKDEEVVYVGQSTNVFVRLRDHADVKDFDRVAYVFCPKNQLNAMESLYIHTLRPKLNLGHPPIPLDQLICMSLAANGS